MVKHITMTGKEIAVLANEGKLIEYGGRPRAVWKGKKIKEYLADLTNPDSFLSPPFFLNLNPNGIYEILDGKQRISILLDYLNSANMEELKRIVERKFDIDRITRTTADDLKPWCEVLNALADLYGDEYEILPPFREKRKLVMEYRRQRELTRKAFYATTSDSK